MAGRILCVDSISLADARDRGRVVASGSHGGLPAGDYYIVALDYVERRMNEILNSSG